MVIRSRARGFTLVELLVVISIIGMLAALLMPAVQSAREAGRRAVCVNNLHNLALAVQSYEQTRHQYPGYMQKMPGSTNNANKYGTFVVPLLPFIERNDIFNGYWNKADILMEGGSGTTILGLANTTPFVELLVCPSDPSFTPTPSPILSYVVNAGSGGTLSGSSNGSGNSSITLDDTTAMTLASGASSIPRNNRNNGLCFDLTGTTSPTTYVSSDFVSGADGLSNTILFSENLSADKWLIKDNSSKSEKAAEMVLNARSGTTFQWFDNGSSYANDLAINGNKLTAPDPATSPMQARPSSMHNMGVNMSFADGRVKFVIDNVSYDVYIQLMTPNGVAASTKASNHNGVSPLLPIGDSDY